VSPTYDTLMRTSTLKDVAEGTAQAGVDRVGGGDAGLDFDGAVTAAGADELPAHRPAGRRGPPSDWNVNVSLLSSHAAFRAA